MSVTVGTKMMSLTLGIAGAAVWLNGMLEGYGGGALRKRLTLRLR